MISSIETLLLFSSRIALFGAKLLLIKSLTRRMERTWKKLSQKLKNLMPSFLLVICSVEIKHFRFEYHIRHFIIYEEVVEL